MNPRRLLTFLLLPFLFSGCTGSGAVNPLSPKAATIGGNSDSSTDNDTVYWSPSPANPPVTSTLQSISLVSDQLGWIVGNGGTVLKYDGQGWKRVQTGITNLGDLYGCSFPSEQEGWAVGAKGVILSYQDGNWSQAISPTSETLYDVVVDRTHRGWAVGTNGTVLFYNGVKWDPVTILMDPVAKTPVTTDLYGVGFSSSTNGSVVGDRGMLVRYDGSQWTVEKSSPISDRVQKVYWVNDVEAWAVGAFGTLLRFNGTSWSKYQGASNQDLYDVAMTSSQDGWAVGQDGCLEHYDGSRWIATRPAPGKPALNSVAFLRKNFGFAVGQNGSILKYQPGGEKTAGTLKVDPKLGAKTPGDPPVWMMSVNILNDGAKAVSNASFEVELPKGYYPVRPSPTATMTPFKPSKPGEKPPLPPTPTRTATPNPTLAAAEAPLASPVAVPVLDFKWEKGVMAYDLGLVDSNILKTLSFSVTRPPSQPGKKIPAAVVKLTAKIDGKKVTGPISFQLDALPKDAPTPGTPTATPVAAVLTPSGKPAPATPVTASPAAVPVVPTKTPVPAAPGWSSNPRATPKPSTP